LLGVFQRFEVLEESHGIALTVVRFSSLVVREPNFQSIRCVIRSRRRVTNSGLKLPFRQPGPRLY
jgi:hypothetical protein